MEVAPRYPELAPLTRLFDKHVLPRVASPGNGARGQA
jgi:hypothetical protein